MIVYLGTAAVVLVGGLWVCRTLFRATEATIDRHMEGEE